MLWVELVDREVCPTHPHPARLFRPSQGAAAGHFWLGWEGWRRSWGTVWGINLLPEPLWGLQPTLHQPPRGDPTPLCLAEPPALELASSALQGSGTTGTMRALCVQALAAGGKRLCKIKAHKY